MSDSHLPTVTGKNMRYSSGKDMRIGDHVRVEQDAVGLVIYDCDNNECVQGYESWLYKGELVGGGKLTKGVMIKMER